MEGSRPAWLRRYHERNLPGLSMKIEVTGGYVVVEKLGIRREALIDKPEEVWKILTNDMEINKEMAAEMILRLIDASHR